MTVQTDLYAICPMDFIATGEAKAFDLAKVDTDGMARPFRIVVVRKTPTLYLGYVNACPHEGVWLNVGAGHFFDTSGAHLQCGRHGALFDVESGLCLSGPCQGSRLEPVTLVATDGDVCITGVSLLEEDLRDEDDDTMEIMIHPD